MSTLPIILLAILSGILNGSYAVPIKLTPKWGWENIWLCFAISGLLLAPWIFAFLLIPDVGKVLADTPAGATAMTFFCGLGWGIGSVAFGLALHLIGFSLGYTLMMGLIAVIGALVPLLVKNPAALVTTGGITILLALFVTTIGIILCGAAGKAREDENQQKESASTNKSKFSKGLVLCFVSGFFSSMINFAFEFGTPLKNAALSQVGVGSNGFISTSIIWAIALSGGFVAFLVYAIYLLAKNKTVGNYTRKETRSYFPWTILMGITFYCSLLCYGMAASALGDAGTTTGWVIFTAGAIITANIWGIMTSEWAGVPKKQMNKMILGSGLLIGAVFLVSYGNSLL